MGRLNSWAPLPIPSWMDLVPAARAMPARRRVDPVLAGLALVIACVSAWCAAPLAFGAAASDSSLVRIDVDVPISTSVTPGFTPGEAAVRLDPAVLPGRIEDTMSRGWVMATNWAGGYEVRLRSTTDPALRGRNAIDGQGATGSFADFRTDAACPCPWSGRGFTTGVFGYSVTVATRGGGDALDTAGWADGSRFRGFDDTSYRAYSTPGGTGTYEMAIRFRSMIPEGGTQQSGSYRAAIVASAHPLI